MNLTLYSKYKAYAAKYYAQKLKCQITGEFFDYAEPKNNWIDNVLDASKTAET